MKKIFIKIKGAEMSVYELKEYQRLKKIGSKVVDNKLLNEF